jgi:hypothetical protein
LEVWVLESINWISFLDSSPWLWENTLVVVGKAMNFLSDTVVSNILGLVVMLVVMLMLVLLLNESWLVEPLEVWVLESIDWISLLNTSPWLWKD